MNDEIKIDPASEKSDLRRTYNRCGWVLFAYTALGFILVRLLDVLIVGAGDAALEFVGKYLLIYNAILVAIPTAAAALFLLRVPRYAPTRKKISVKGFGAVVLIAFGVSYVGNTVSRFLINLVYAFSGIEITDRVSAAISAVEPWQVILCTVLLAPIMEEFLFRKLLIDRLYRHGELLAILVSAAFFGLFHQNVYQIAGAAGAGLVLGYLYCKTGSYLAVTLLHMIYNLIGVIPVFLSARVSDYAGMSAEELAALPPELAADYNSAMAALLAYSGVIMAINIVGIVLIIVFRKKIVIEKNAPALLESDKRDIVLRAPGIVAAGVIMIVLTVVSIIQMI
ncbi:MAG: CPBP family intramembrane metalloprotease [Clostridia bacterium]|nr:CPBP family intramembrane metalloprotease [Clostridia bacterium]